MKDIDFEQELYNHFGQVKDFTLGMRIGRHFYDLGCRRTAEKYDEIEYNRQRAEESVPNDLEEAARKYFEEPDNSWEVREVFIAGAKWQKQHDAELIEIAYNDGITIGMTKQKEQMMKVAVEGEICHHRAGVDYLDYDIARLDKYIFSRFKVGDKVRIIIVKEDKK